MKTRPIEPAEVDFGGDPGDEREGVPHSPRYGDRYHPRIGALAQAQHVFLQGNGLPARWAGRDRFAVLETGFGLGHNFLATWDAWRNDPARCTRLCFVSVERHPLRLDDLRRVHAGSPLPALAAALLQAWPPLTPNLHLLDFEGGRVQLLLALGDVAELLPGLRVQADAFFLDGFAPARNPEMWQPRVLKALGRKASPGATLATWSVARELRQGLLSAGFAVERAPGIGGKREITLARWAPRHVAPALPGAAVATTQALVVGAGIAGAAVAQALARQGLTVTVFEAQAAPAARTSGNPAGLFHGSVHGDDGHYARLFRAAALQAQRDHAAAIATGVPGSTAGLLRLAAGAEGVAAMQALLQCLGLPGDYVQALDRAAASALSGVPLPAPAWHYPGGGWVAPPAWVVQALAQPGVAMRCGTPVARIDRHRGGWQLRDQQGRVLAQAPLLVLANADEAARLLAPLGWARWPLSHSRGQVTYWSGARTALRLPVAGEGYAIALPEGGLLCGATRDEGEPEDDAAPRSTDDARNLARLQSLTGIAPGSAPLQGRVGWRLQSDDRLPIAGPLALTHFEAAQRLDQPRLLPREPGLFVFTALGARGLTLAPLLARLLAAQATGAPWPLEQDLADGVDPARWTVRAARRSSGGTA